MKLCKFEHTGCTLPNVHLSDPPGIGCYVAPGWECSVHCVRLRLTGTFNLLLSNGALRDLLFCFVLRLNSASHVLTKEKCPREKVVIKNDIFSQKLLCESQFFCIPNNLLSPPLLWDLVMLQKNTVSPGHCSYTALIFPWWKTPTPIASSCILYIEEKVDGMR